MQIPKLDEGNAGGVFCCGAYLIVLIRVNDNHWNLVDTIIHESVHVFRKSMEFVQEESPGEEVEAYTIANIAVNLLKDFETCRT